MEYAHLELGQDIQSVSGTYTPLKEFRLQRNGRDVLCVVGTAVVDTACCGSGSFLYATIPGYVIDWKARQNPSGLPLSEVEPVADEAVKRDIAKALLETESVYNVNFW